MASQNQGGDPPVLPIVGCPDCGRKVVTYVARRGQYAGERFYKCRHHNPAVGGCDFYRWQEAYAEHLASNPQAQIQAVQVGQGAQAPVGAEGHQNVPPGGSQFDSSASGAVGGYMVAAAPMAGRQGSTGVDAQSINLVVSVANLVIGVGITKTNNFEGVCVQIRVPECYRIHINLIFLKVCKMIWQQVPCVLRPALQNVISWYMIHAKDIKDLHINILSGCC